MSKPPAFQLYASDFLVGIMGMDDGEVGVYMRMLAIQWLKGGLPRNPVEIKRIVGSRKLPSAAVLAKFELGNDGLLRNARLEEERRKQAEFRESRARNASARWRGQRTKSPQPVTLEDHTPDDLLTEAQASAQAHTVGVPEDFARWVYADWSTRGGKDSGNVKVSWSLYVKKRWNRERIEWESGTHNGNKKPNRNSKRPPSKFANDLKTGGSTE